MIDVEKYGAIEIEQAVLNPLLIFQNIMGLDIPDDGMPYTTTLYKTLYDMFDSLFTYETCGDKLKEIFDKYGILEEDLNRIIRSRGNKTSMFLQLMNCVKEDIMDLHAETCGSILSASVADEIRIGLNKLLTNLFIDEYSIYEELKANTMFSNQSLTLVVELFGELCKNIVDCLMEKEGNRLGRLRKNYDTSETEVAFVTDEKGNTSIDVTPKETIKINNSEKKKDKVRLSQNVNNLDKDQGVKLKHPKETVDCDYKFHEAVKEYKIILSKLLFLLNSVDEDNYISHNTIFGTELRKLKINQKFMKQSDWFDGIKYDVDEVRFRCRFISYVLTWIIDNLEEISNICYNLNEDGKYIEYETKFEYVENTVGKMCDLICYLLSGKGDNEALMYFNDIQTYLEIIDNGGIKRNYKKVKTIRDQSFIINERLKPFCGSEDCITIDAMLKVAYLISTNDTSAKGVVDLDTHYKFRSTKKTKMLLKELGSSILLSREDYDIPKLFKFYVKSDPLLLSKWSDVNEDRELIIGCVALSYYSFMINNKRIRRKVNRLLA